MESNGIGCLVAETTGLNGVLKQILLTLSSPTQHSVVNQCLDEEVHDLNSGTASQRESAVLFLAVLWVNACIASKSLDAEVVFDDC